MTTSYSRLRLLRWGLLFALVNGLILSIASLRYLSFMPELSGWIQRGYLFNSLFSHFSSLALLGLIGVSLLILCFPRKVLILPVGIMGGSVALTLLIVDTFVYAQYRFHINGFVFSMLLNAGNDILNLSWLSWLLIVLMLVGILGLQTLLALWLWKQSQRGINRWFGYSYLTILVISTLGTHLAHAWADANQDLRITAMTRYIPFFYPMTAKRFFAKAGWIDQRPDDQRSALAQTDWSKGNRLHYPQEPIQCEAATQPLNILTILVDSLRYDQVTAEIMPGTHALSQQSQSLMFNEHLSGGNSTRAGVYSLFYGLPDPYWSSIVSNQQSPVLIDELIKQDYAMGIFSSATLTYPVFDQTVFSAIENLAVNTEGSQPWQRDEQVLKNWQQFLALREKHRPFYGFLFFDAVHGYSHPPDYAYKIEPYWERIDHFKLNKDFDPTPYYNRYKTAVHYVDSLIKRVLDDLKARNLLEETLVIITSDHGESFNDNKMNFWGHGSTFNRVLLQVPLIIHWPGKEKSSIDYRTSHADITGTLMQDILGCTTPMSAYSSGKHLLNDQHRPWTLAGDYWAHAIIEHERMIVSYRGRGGYYEVLDFNNRPARDNRLNADISAEILNEFSRFYH